MPVKILQTSDTERYARMLAATSRTAKEFCRRNLFSYESFKGIKRGRNPSHAAYNRIAMLGELIDRSYRGWVLYMDADAYIYDLDFDLEGYLASKTGHSAVIATIEGQAVPWHVNSGVLLFNLAHPLGIALVREWARRFAEITDEQLAAVTSVWGDLDDQTLLYLSLRENPELRNSVLYEDARLLNHSHARFIRQYLAILDQNIASRTDAIERAVAAVLDP